MREEENPLSPNTIGNTIIYYKTNIARSTSGDTGPKVYIGRFLFLQCVPKSS